MSGLGSLVAYRRLGGAYRFRAQLRLGLHLHDGVAAGGRAGRVGGVNPVCLQRSVAHQRVLRVPHEAAIIRTGVTVGGDAVLGPRREEGLMR